jgi:excisionase family DNA binding protein
METTQPIDVVAIASRVLEALDIDHLSLVGPQADEEQGIVAPEQRAASVEELAARLNELIREINHCRLTQQRLENALAQVQQQVWLLPAYLIRLEQWSVEAEARLMQLASAYGDGGLAISAEAPSEMARWASVKEVAERLGLSESTVRRYVRQGILPAVRLPIGRGLRLRWSDVLSRLPEAEPLPKGNQQEP